MTTFALAALALSGAGLALLHLLGLATRRLVIDAPLAWLVGSGWFALLSALARFGAGLPFSRPLAAAVLAAPPLAWAALRRRGPRAPFAPAPPAGGAAARWRPRPLWLWIPVAAFVAVVLGAILLHGFNTPTNTDDGVRVRAFTPLLAYDDAWPEEARTLLVLAGAVPTFVPALGWLLAGTVDHFHVNYVVLLDLVAFLALAVGLASSRGRPERGWAAALGVLSIPLFVYHCTTTYQDAVLAIFVGAALLLAMEYGRARDAGDLGRALLLLVCAAMVKREGELVAASIAGLLLAQAAWDRARGAPVPLGRLAALVLAPAAALAVAKVAAVGVAEAFPVVRMLATRARGEALVGGGPPSALLRERAAEVFAGALFRAGNAGGVYWALAATVALRARALARPWLGWSLGAVALLLAEAAVSAIWLVPEYTVDETTVHRALLVATVPAILWVAAALVDAAFPEALAGAPPRGAEGAAPPARAGEGEAA